MNRDGSSWHLFRWRDVLSLIIGAPVEKSRILCPSDVLPHGRNARNSCVTNVCNAPLSKRPPDYVHANVGPLFDVQTCPYCAILFGQLFPVGWGKKWTSIFKAIKLCLRKVIIVYSAVTYCWISNMSVCTCKCVQLWSLLYKC
jgi:hypothetical protein